MSFRFITQLNVRVINGSESLCSLRTPNKQRAAHSVNTDSTHPHFPGAPTYANIRLFYYEEPTAALNNTEHLPSLSGASPRSPTL